MAQGGGVKNDRSRERDTEAGMTKAQKEAVLKEENRIRKYKAEHASVVDENGVLNPLGDIQIRKGTSSKVAINTEKVPANSIIIHNHPTVREDTGIGQRVGISLSGADLRVAALTNAREVRAVTENYTYSVKRPSGGWGSLSPNRIKAEFNAISDRELSKYMALGIQQISRGQLNTSRSRSEFNGRVNALISHTAMKELAKKYGFTYTRRKSS